MALPEGSSIGGSIFELRDNDGNDNNLGKAVFVATRPVPLPLPNLLANVLLLAAEEKSERSVPELTALVGVLLSDAAGKGELDCRYRRIVSCGLVGWTLDEDEREEKAPPLLGSLGLDRILDASLVLCRPGAMMIIVLRILNV